MECTSHPVPSPVTLDDLERVLTTSKATSAVFQAHPKIKDAYILQWDGHGNPVTFSPAVYDEHPSTVQLITYGNPLLDELLCKSPEPGGVTRAAGALCDDGEMPVCAWYWLEPERLSYEALATLPDLEARLSVPGTADIEIPAKLLHEVGEDFKARVAEIQKRQAEVLRQRALGVLPGGACPSAAAAGQGSPG